MIAFSLRMRIGRERLDSLAHVRLVNGSRRSFIKENMTTHRAPPALAHIDDAELERLASTWRAQALRGNREAFGIAHALEVEQRRRLRPSQMAPLAREPVLRRRWWQMWRRASAPAAGTHGDATPSSGQPE